MPPIKIIMKIKGSQDELIICESTILIEDVWIIIAIIIGMGLDIVVIKKILVKIMVTKIVIKISENS